MIHLKYDVEAGIIVADYVEGNVHMINAMFDEDALKVFHFWKALEKEYSVNEVVEIHDEAGTLEQYLDIMRRFAEAD